MKLPHAYTRRRAVGLLSAEAFRLHMLALDWCAEQRTNGSIAEEDISMLPRIPRSWRALTVELVAAGLWEQAGALWRVLDAEQEGEEPARAVSPELSAKRAEAGRKGGLARSKPGNLLQQREQKRSNLLEANQANLPGFAGANATDPSSPLELPSPESLSSPSDSALLAASLIPDPEPAESFSHVGAARPKRRWRKVPAEWEPSEQHRELARERGVDFELELSRFRDHEFAAAKSDPNATFRNWLRNARPTRPGVVHPNGSGQNFARLSARIARMEREEAEREAH